MHRVTSSTRLWNLQRASNKTVKPDNRELYRHTGAHGSCVRRESIKADRRSVRPCFVSENIAKPKSCGHEITIGLITLINHIVA